MPFTADVDEILIDVVAENPILYDLKIESYKDGQKNEECKKRWKYIKDSYNRYKRKKKAGTGSSAAPKHSKWEFYERLQFLEVSSCHRKSISNVPNLSQKSPKESTETANNEDDNDSDSNTDGDLDEQYDTQLTEAAIVNETERSQGNINNITQKSSQDTSKVTKTTQKRKDDPSRMNFYSTYMKERDTQRQALLQNTVAENVEKNAYDDDVSSFGDHIKSVLQKLPPILKVKAKTEIFNTMSKYELLAMETPNSTRATSSNSNYSTYTTFSCTCANIYTSRPF
ncbi:uncharacterized protein LOC116163194 [Photinus pyralis]|uniref:uncharacterized protein LOC116163194 n=1 Tax=Photinus pyralis TaxID=7054 RepID=UPI0012678196|nr:uncharacterized protein LOC116163194 [Photinus pyralis]